MYFLLNQLSLHSVKVVETKLRRELNLQESVHIECRRLQHREVAPVERGHRRIRGDCADRHCPVPNLARVRQVEHRPVGRRPQTVLFRAQVRLLWQSDRHPYR